MYYTGPTQKNQAIFLFSNLTKREKTDKILLFAGSNQKAEALYLFKISFLLYYFQSGRLFIPLGMDSLIFFAKG
jgi:hypothetical protein